MTIIILFANLFYYLKSLFIVKNQYFKSRRIDNLPTVHYYNQPKPEWVRKEIIRLKALLPKFGCRKIADTFNRIHEASTGMRVGKTFVSDVIRQHKYEIQILRRQIKNKKPRDFAHNVYWGIDLTGKQDESGKIHNIFGIIEFQSRACLNMSALKDKSSITLLRCILDCIEKYGMPKIIRTDNEAVFTSRLFRFGLKFLGIKWKSIQLSSPWQNGQIEKLFGTLKESLDHWRVYSIKQLNGDLDVFWLWYNHIRPHQNLDGRTPAEVWNGKNIFKTGYKSSHYFSEWEGLLTGYYLPI
jgi:putative transposase